MHNMRPDLPKALAEQMKKEGFENPYQLSLEAEVAHTTVLQCLSKRRDRKPNPEVQTLIKLARTLRVSITFFFYQKFQTIPGSDLWGEIISCVGDIANEEVQAALKFFEVLGSGPENAKTGLVSHLNSIHIERRRRKIKGKPTRKHPKIKAL